MVTKVLRIVFAFVLCNGLLHAQSAGVSRKFDFNADLQKALQDTKTSLPLIKTALNTLNKDFQAARYFETSKIESITKDRAHDNKSVGIIIDFAYSGSGPLIGFEGAIIDPVLDAVPAYFRSFCSTVLATSLSTVFNGRRVNDPLTKRVVVRTGPFVEFLFKVALLTKDKSQKKVIAKDFSAQLMILIFRLTQTNGFKNINEVFTAFPKPLKRLVDRIKIKNRSLNQHLNGYVLKFQEIINYDFTKPDAAILGKKDTAQIIKILSAILIRAVVDYSKARTAFLKTPEGLQAYAKMKESLKKPQAIPQDTGEFRRAIPGYVTIEAELQDRLMTLFMRCAAYKSIKIFLVQKLGSVLNPLLGLVGMKLEDMLPADDKVPASAEEEVMTEDESDLFFDEDPLFADFDITESAASEPAFEPEVVVAQAKTTQKIAQGQKPVAAQKGATAQNKVAAQAKTKTPAQSVAPAVMSNDIHPIDWLYEVMDEFDRLDALGIITPHQEAELELEIMDACDVAQEEVSFFDKDELIELAYVLFDLDSYLVNANNQKRISSFLAQVKKQLKAMGVSISI